MGRKNGSHLLAEEIQYRDSSKSDSNGLPQFGVGDVKTHQMPTLAREFNISLSTVHGYIEEHRKLLRAQTIDLAAART